MITEKRAYEAQKGTIRSGARRPRSVHPPSHGKLLNRSVHPRSKSEENVHYGSLLRRFLRDGRSLYFRLVVLLRYRHIRSVVLLRIHRVRYVAFVVPLSFGEFLVTSSS